VHISASGQVKILIVSQETFKNENYQIVTNKVFDEIEKFLYFMTEAAQVIV